MHSAINKGGIAKRSANVGSMLTVVHDLLVSSGLLLPLPDWPVCWSLAHTTVHMCWGKRCPKRDIGLFSTESVSLQAISYHSCHIGNGTRVPEFTRTLVTPPL